MSDRNRRVVCRRTALRLALAVAGSGLAGSGCATVNGLGVGWGLSPVSPNPLHVPGGPDDFEWVWKHSVAVLEEYFLVSKEDRLAHTIVTDPKMGATIVEPWYGDSVGFRERLESTFQTIRRWAEVTVKPEPGGGYAVEVKVFKELEDLTKPERSTGGTRAVFDSDFPVNRSREIVGPVPLPNGWIPRGRDVKLEQVILAQLRDRLLL